MISFQSNPSRFVHCIPDVFKTILISKHLVIEVHTRGARMLFGYLTDLFVHFHFLFIPLLLGIIDSDIANHIVKLLTCSGTLFAVGARFDFFNKYLHLPIVFGVCGQSCSLISVEVIRLNDKPLLFWVSNGHFVYGLALTVPCFSEDCSSRDLIVHFRRVAWCSWFFQVLKGDWRVLWMGTLGNGC